MSLSLSDFEVCVYSVGPSSCVEFGIYVFFLPVAFSRFVQGLRFVLHVSLYQGVRFACIRSRILFSVRVYGDFPLLSRRPLVYYMLFSVRLVSAELRACRVSGRPIAILSTCCVFLAFHVVRSCRSFLFTSRIFIGSPHAS